MEARNPTRAYGSYYKTPIVYPLLFILLIMFAAFELNLSLPQDALKPPTGFATAEAGIHDDAALNTLVAQETLPEDAPVITSKGFSLLKPVTKASKYASDGTLGIMFLKTMPSELRIAGVKVTNNATGKGCLTVENPKVISQSCETFYIEAASCDTTPTRNMILEYDVAIYYDTAFGPFDIPCKSSGRLSVWL